jgi:hypothetical protein
VNVPESKVLEIIGAQQVEIALLRERVGILSAHQCQKCPAECCKPRPEGAPE